MILLLLLSITWQIVKVDTAGDVGSFSSLVLRNFEIHIAYYDSKGNLIKYAYSEDFGVTWGFDTVLTFGAGNSLRWLSMALDKNGNPHIAYSDNQNTDLYHVYYDGTSWINESVDAEGDIGNFCSIFIDDSDHIHIAYRRLIPRALKYAFKRDVWQTEVVDAVRAQGIDIAVHNNKVHITYWDTQNNKLKYARGSFGNWMIYDVEGNNTNTGRQSSVSVDSLGIPHISYFRYQGATGLKYAFLNGSVFDTFYLDSFKAGLFPAEGQWSSIKLGPLDSLWISYYDDNIGGLKVLKRGELKWDTLIVDSLGDVGRYCALDLNPYGEPVISYYDATNGDLKLAIGKRPDTSPPGPPENLRANGSNPSPWNNTGVFELTWVTPFDPSGIRRGLYKLYSPPSFNFDTTGSLKAYSPDTVVITQQGVIDLYMWFEDNAGNVDFNNNSLVVLRYDAVLPQGSNVNIPFKYSNTAQFTVTWTKGTDYGIVPSGIKSFNVYYKDGENPWQTFLLDYPDTFAVFNGVDGHRYYFESVAIDSASNTEPRLYVFEDTVKVDLTPPSAPIDLSVYPSTWTQDSIFIFTWNEPLDFTGIKDRFYKLLNPPIGANDFDGVLQGSPDTIKILKEGTLSVYLWFSDSAGNSGWQNYGNISIKRDTSRPFNSVVNILPLYINQTTFTIEWSKGNDNVSGIFSYDLYYKVKGGNWNLYQSNISDTFISFNFSIVDTMYYFEVVAKDSAGNLEIISGIPEDSVFVDVSAPDPPQNLLANGSNPSPWSFDSIFVLTWINPQEPNGILKALYKIGSKPQSNFDTTGSLKPFPPDTVYTTIEGGVWLYMWLVDGLGNLDYRKRDSVLLRHDHTPPYGAVIEVPLYSNKDTVLISWTQAQDQGGSGIRGYDIYYKDGSGPWNLLINDTNSLNALFVGLDGHKYYFEAVSRDSAGNLEIQNMLPEDSIIFDLTPPSIISINPPDGAQNVPANTDIIITFSEKLKTSTVSDTNFEIEGKISGFHNFSLIYDSLNYTVTLSLQTGFASQETVSVKVSRNIKDLADNPLQGQNQFFFVTEIVPDTEGPLCVTSISPASPEPFNYLYLYAFVSDTGYGNSKIVYAEMFIDLIGPDSTGIPLDPVDGSYDENTEYVHKKIDLAPYGFKPGETHYIFVHAKDITGNFGPFDTIMFTVSPDDDTLPPVFLSFTQDTFMPGASFYIKGIIQDPSEVYDESTGSDGQGVYIWWDTDGEIDTTYKELQLDRISGDTFRTINQITGPNSGEIVYKVYAHDNDFDTEHPLDRTKGSSQLFKIVFYSPMVVELSHSPDIVYIGDSLNVRITANLPFTYPPLCSLVTSKGSLKEEIPVFKGSENEYIGKIITSGADIGKARIVAYYYDFGKLKREEDTVLIKAKGEFMPENTVYVWPNPAGNEGNFHFYINQNAKVKVEIFDIRGKKIMESSGVFKGGLKPHTINSNAIKLNLRNLAPGIYIFRLRAEAIDTDEKKTVIKKFAIVR